MQPADCVIVERRLRPIYESLDNGYYKKALQEAEKVLKKQPNCSCAKVLRGLALLRLGKVAECNDILKVVLEDVPADEMTLQAISICFKELNQQDKVCEVYEMALKKNPGKEELLSHLFMAYVRVGNYKKQHVTAMNLYKIKPKNPYYFWAVMSVVMQAHDADEKTRQNICLPLAERMVQKFVNERKIESDAETYLYLMILDLMGKWEEALKVLTALPVPWSASHSDLFSEKRLDLMRKLGQWNELHASYKNLIEKELTVLQALFPSSPGEWSHMMGYMNSALKILDQGNDVDLNEIESFISEVHMKSKTRSASLARLELMRIRSERGEKSSKCIDLLVEYSYEFSRKQACFGDLKPYFAAWLTTTVTRKEFLSRIKDFRKDMNWPKDVTVDTLNRRIFYLQAERCLGHVEELDVPEVKHYVQERLRDWKSAEHLCVGLLPTDYRPTDYLALLAVFGCIDLWRRVVQSRESVESCWRAERNYLVKAICIAEEAMEVSPANHQFKLQLVLLYSFLGGVKQLPALQAAMDIKHIIIDTLGHMFAPFMLPFAFSGSASHFRAMLAFYASGQNDTMESLITAYKYGTFHKVKEFIDFRDRIRSSQMCAYVLREKVVEEVLILPSSQSQTEDALSSAKSLFERYHCNVDSLRDNRDFRVTVCIQPEGRDLSAANIEDSRVWDIAFMRMRDVMFKALSICSGCHILPIGDDVSPGSSLRSLAEELRQLISSLAGETNGEMNGKEEGTLEVPTSSKDDEYSFKMNLPARPRLKAFLGDVDLLGCVRLAVESASVAAEWSPKTNNIDSSSFNALHECLVHCVHSVQMMLKSEATQLLFNDLARVIERLTALAETISFIVALTGLVILKLKPHPLSGAKKSSKKKKDHATDVDTKQNRFLLVMETFVDQLESILESLINMLSQFNADSTAARLEFQMKLHDSCDDFMEDPRRGTVLSVLLRNQDASLSERFCGGKTEQACSDCCAVLIMKVTVDGSSRMTNIHFSVEKMENGVVDYHKKYKERKKQFKSLIYENESFKDQLLKAQHKLLKLSRDQKFLMDRLLHFEQPMSDAASSSGEETDSTDEDVPEPVISNKRKKPVVEDEKEPRVMPPLVTASKPKAKSAPRKPSVPKEKKKPEPKRRPRKSTPTSSSSASQPLSGSTPPGSGLLQSNVHSGVGLTYGVSSTLASHSLSQLARATTVGSLQDWARRDQNPSRSSDPQ
ncbi:unnamed protein product [Notodromas monacha]|uniref:N-terminal acetyltransferase B complex subunit MDM20 homolog n=1 Tax=Notodromas monacha TaxID=399045 RepID=A0A7R9BEJ0_9CRUS|nr:unnamed protein product [Notodromas monacha]CAG0913917.1 unnamed protein product [Notodromas monacha]